MIAEISFCYQIVDKGNNVFAKKTDYTKTFNNWIDCASKLADMLEYIYNKKE